MNEQLRVSENLLEDLIVSQCLRDARTESAYYVVWGPGVDGERFATRPDAVALARETEVADMSWPTEVIECVSSGARHSYRRVWPSTSDSYGELRTC